MFLNIKRKGKKLLFNEIELQEYMHTKINEICNFASSVIVALIMVTLIAILTVFKAGDIFLYALIILPLVARSYVHKMVNKWLQNIFKDIIGV